MPYLADHTTVDDSLNRSAMLKQVVDHILSATPPTVIGLHGDWGSGKSSFLLQIEAVLTTNKQHQGEIHEKNIPIPDSLKNITTASAMHPVVWFEAWRHQNDPQPIVTLLQAIRRQLSPAHRLINKTSKVSKVAIETALAGIDGITQLIGFKVNPKEIRDIGERYERESYEIPTFTTSITSLLESAIETVIKGYSSKPNADRVVVLIDDLDRCEPDMARHLLQGLKVFLNLKNVVYVIAMDESVIVELLASQDSRQGQTQSALSQRSDQRRARQYLEKICQSIYRLSFPADPEDVFAKYLAELDAPPFAVDRFREVSRDISVVPPNPRKIKMLANTTMQFLKGFLMTRSEDAEETTVAVILAYTIAYSSLFEPDLFRRIQRYGDEVFSDWLLPVCRGNPASVPSELQNAIALPRELLPGTSFPDAITDGVFYPALLLKQLPAVTKAQVQAILGQ